MIDIKELTKYYGETCAINNLSFQIPKGQVLGLLGPNGAGKTTTLRILTGYLSPTSGTALVKDIDVRDQPLKVKELVGYLPESSPLYPDMLVFDYLNYIAAIRGLDKDKKAGRIKELSLLCGIAEVMHKTINTLSKGYKQRVGIAVAMMSDPEILVLDEPTSGLDPNQIVDIRSIIKDIGKEKTIILSTHILSEAEATCDRIVIINQGDVVADDTTELLAASASNEIILKLTLEGPGKKDIKSLLSTIEDIDSIAMEKNGKQIDISIACKKDIRADIYKKIKEQDWILLKLMQEKKSLEHIFRQLTKEN